MPYLLRPGQEGGDAPSRAACPVVRSSSAYPSTPYCQATRPQHHPPKAPPNPRQPTPLAPCWDPHPPHRTILQESCRASPDYHVQADPRGTQGWVTKAASAASARPTCRQTHRKEAGGSWSLDGSRGRRRPQTAAVSAGTPPRCPQQSQRPKRAQLQERARLPGLPKVGAGAKPCHLGSPANPASGPGNAALHAPHGRSASLPSHRRLQWSASEVCPRNLHLWLEKRVISHPSLNIHADSKSSMLLFSASGPHAFAPKSLAAVGYGQTFFGTRGSHSNLPVFTAETPLLSLPYLDRLSRHAPDRPLPVQRWFDPHWPCTSRPAKPGPGWSRLGLAR